MTRTGGRHTGLGHGPGLCKCPKHQTRNSLYRDDFLALHGPGPHVCGEKKMGCGLPVMFDEGVIDHVDEDRTNNVPDNWQLMHKKCHDRKSRNVAWQNDEYAAKQRARLNELNADPSIRAGRSECASEQWERRALGDVNAIGRRHE